MNRAAILIALALGMFAAPLTAQTRAPDRADHKPVMLRHLLSGKERIDPA